MPEVVTLPQSVPRDGMSSRKKRLPFLPYDPVLESESDARFDVFKHSEIELGSSEASSQTHHNEVFALLNRQQRNQALAHQPRSSPAWGAEQVRHLFMRAGTSRDFATIKYNEFGIEQWVAVYDGPVSGRDEPEAVTVDGVGNVYVTGTSENTGRNYDYATVKYDSSGKEQWVRRYDGGDYEGASAIVVDETGSVYITGNSGTLKYDRFGN